MNFKAYFLTEGQNIRFGAWAKDGTVVVYIDRTRYVFITDAVYHYQLQKLAKYRPWSALNKIKEMVKAGHATQKEPPEEHMGNTNTPNPVPPIRSKPVQGSLFDGQSSL